MSDERFDKLMKKSLESVRPGYRPATWDRFRRRLPVTGFWPWLLQHGGWMLSGLMLAGWLTTLYALRENQQVIRQLSTRTDETQSGPVAPAALRPALTTTRRVDTVYIVQRTVIEHRHVYEPMSGAPANTRPRYQPESGADIPVASGSFPTPSGVDRPIAFAQPTSASAPIRQTTRPEQRTDSVNRAIAAATSTIPADTAQLELKRPALTQSDSAAQKSVATPVPTSAARPTEQHRLPFRLSSLQPRVGIETMVTLNGAGVGPALELFPTENVGLSVGLQVSQLRAENHWELRDFNSATGTEFVERYRAYLPAQYDQIRDISVRTSLVSLPVTLKYYVPLRRAWSLLFQAGTSFDVAAYQQVRYESYYRGEEQSHAFEINVQPRFFHNFIFGAGVQYRRPRISVQLNPYYLYDFRNLANTPAGSNVGVKASVWLDLFK